MGIYLSFNFVKKDKELFAGELPSLRMYEAKLPLVEKNFYNNGNDSVSFYGGGYIFSEFEQNAGNRWEYYQYHNDCYFINMVNTLCGIDQRDYDDRTVFLFEMDLIKNAFQNVIKYAKNGGFTNKEYYEEDMKLLNIFLENIIKNEEKNLLISCWIG
ncbi:hypothetical protein [Flavobacterium sp. N2038]|uniref:hypothetical protein n=1 Tax=Flavobacterium sp. N2038 TaxID=2986829 RepID=UPI0022246537|nr:hypothetical protein [Flavobacterium sp. N2038]